MSRMPTRGKIEVALLAAVWAVVSWQLCANVIENGWLAALLVLGISVAAALLLVRLARLWHREQ